MIYISAVLSPVVITDDDPLITQDLVDRINNDPLSTFEAFLNPKWSQKTRGEAKKFLSPIRPNPVNHGSARPVGYDESLFHNADVRFLSGTCTQINKNTIPYSQGAHQLCNELLVDSKNPAAGTLYFPVYDVTKLCSSWAPAVTSAMTSSLWRWTPKTASLSPFNLSMMFILDCDMLGDPCVERPPLSAYEQFWRRYIPTSTNWDPTNEHKQNTPDQVNYLRTPSNSLTQEQCNKYNGCYPGENPLSHSCAREMVLTGVCEPNGNDQSCPIYFLYNWRWMKSHIAEVGPITSSILVYPSLFTFAYRVPPDPPRETFYPGVTQNVYSSAGEKNGILGMLDVTIIGWGQSRINLSSKTESQKSTYRWWYVIPHFGQEASPSSTTHIASLPCFEFYFRMNHNESNVIIKDDDPWESITNFQFNGKKCIHQGSTGDPFPTGVIKFNRRFDDCNIESQAVGAVPHNFQPKPYRSPRPTWSGVWEAVDI